MIHMLMLYRRGVRLMSAMQSQTGQCVPTPCEIFSFSKSQSTTAHRLNWGKLSRPSRHCLLLAISAGGGVFLLQPVILILLWFERPPSGHVLGIRRGLGPPLQEGVISETSTMTWLLVHPTHCLQGQGVISLLLFQVSIVHSLSVSFG